MGDKLVKQSDGPLTNYEINILWWGRCKGMPILGVCWIFFCRNELSFITYHYHRFCILWWWPLLSSPSTIIMALRMQQKLFWSSNFMFCLEFSGTYHPPPFLALTQSFRFGHLERDVLLENPRPRGMETYEKYEFFLEWIIFPHGGDFLPVRRL